MEPAHTEGLTEKHAATKPQRVFCAEKSVCFIGEAQVSQHPHL